MSRSTFQNKQRNRVTSWLIIAVLALLLMIPAAGVVQAAGTVTGLVFRDYNANGVQDPNEGGVGGVVITAYGAAGTVVGTTTSSATLATLGTYSISWTGPDTRVRLEFSGLPGVAQQGAVSSAAGGSGTSVQFVDAGATNVNYGINRPSDYCLATPNLKLVTTCFELGAQNTGTERVVVSHNYDGTGTDNTVAVDTQVGTTWGVAYRRPLAGSPAGTGTIYVSAFAKRQADYGPNGSGAIYAINEATLGSTLLTVIPNAGTTLHNPANYAIDSTFYAAPGKEGLGDLDISEDGTTLFVINLNDRQLYSVDIATGTSTARGIIGPAAATCVNGIYRPFGLGVRDGLVYVGGVCTGETAPLGTTGVLQAFVYSFNPATNASVQVLNFFLNYPRGCADIDPSYDDGVPPAGVTCRTGTLGSQADWQPWRDTWPTPDQTPPGTGFSPGGQEFFAYAQPILAGIEFVGEDMVVSLRDRMGDQIGYLDNGPDGPGGAFPDNLITVTAGDILRASPNGAGGWTIEAGAQGVDFGPSAGANPPYSEQGPGNGEFYWQDNLAGAHDETITGGIVQVPGAPEISAEVMDPGTIFSAGTAWFDNGTGARNREFTIIPATAPFGKGNGLGDLAALCNSAPIEIGNYVWFDANQNGIQDANEQPLAGVVVTLTDAAGNPILVGGNPVTATTDAQGRYVFSSNAAGSTASFIYNVPFVQNTAYQVRIDTTQPNLAGYSLTTPNVGGGTGAPAVRDSNGVTSGNFAIANVTTGTAGQNNHTIDFGFYTQPYSLGNRVWFDDGRGGGTANDGIQNGTEIGIDGVTVNLLNSLGNVIATTVTTAGGYYRFDNLAPGSYTVEIPASNFVSPTGVLAGMTSSADAPTSATPNNDVDRDDNGVNLVGGGVRSNPIQLGPPGPLEPTTTTDLGPGDTTLLPTGRSNLTVDFGFFLTPPVTTYSLGNRVWADNNDSGTIDGGERGVGGVVLNLYPVTGGVPAATPIRTLTTDANGYYLFDNLPPGDYVVEVAGSNFNPGGPLVGSRSSTPDETNPNSDIDSNDNGIGTASGAVRSGIVTLGPGGTEPTGEGDVGPQGTGVAADDHSNLTVDFGFVGVPNSGSGSGSGPAPIRLDPSIVKLVDPKFALPGEDVRWTIVVTNSHSVAINNVTFVDDFPSQLEIISTSADNTVGSLVVSGNRVTYSIVVINPGQSVRVNVLTRIRNGTPVPFIITNTVNLTNGLVGSSTSIIASASASVYSVGSLPATGFAPAWREPLFIGLSVLLTLLGIGAIRVWQRGYRSS